MQSLRDPETGPSTVPGQRSGRAGSSLSSSSPSSLYWRAQRLGTGLAGSRPAGTGRPRWWGARGNQQAVGTEERRIMELGLSSRSFLQAIMHAWVLGLCKVEAHRHSECPLHERTRRGWQGKQQEASQRTMTRSDEYFRTFVVPSRPSRDIARGRLMLHWKPAHDAAGSPACRRSWKARQQGTEGDDGAFLQTRPLATPYEALEAVGRF